PQSAAAVVKELMGLERGSSIKPPPPKPAEPEPEGGATVMWPPPEPASRPAPPALKGPPAKRKLLTVLAGVLLVCLLGLAYQFGMTAVRAVTNKGVLEILVQDPQVEVVVKGANEALLADRTTERTLVVPAGEGEVEVFDPGASTRLAAAKFRVNRGGRA